MLFVLPEGILLLAYGLLIFFYKKWWDRLPPEEMEPFQKAVQVSIIIAARNEAENIPFLLQALAQQTYPTGLLEIIIVDDHSTDATAQLVQHASVENVHLLSLSGDAAHSSKKKAIAAGVERAKGELVVTTDADCTFSPNWIEALVSFYIRNNAQFIAAPVRYSSDDSFLHRFQTLDFLTLQGITGAGVSAQFHTMCNGANLAYRRSTFFEVKGFSGIDQIASGDDMLLMYKIWQRYPQQVFYLRSKEAIVDTKPMNTWRAFIKQRIRWASKTTHYQDKRIFWTLLLVYLVDLYFFVLLIASIWKVYYLPAALLYLVLKTVVELPFVYAVSKFFGQQRLIAYFPFFQPVHILYTVAIGFISQFGKYEWKGRRTK
ncbi:MAG: glycosyltransferase [Flavisolibacter sp.]|nr:glycosyltransferase [Flavisolibacter sp.]